MTDLEYARIQEWLLDHNRLVDRATVRAALEYMKAERDRFQRIYLQVKQERDSYLDALKKVKDDLRG